MKKHLLSLTAFCVMMLSLAPLEAKGALRVDIMNPGQNTVTLAGIHDITP